MSRGMPKEQRKEFWDEVRRERSRLVQAYFVDRSEHFLGLMRYPVGKLGFETLDQCLDIRDTNWIGHYEKEVNRRIAEMQELGDDIWALVEELREEEAR